MIRNEEPSDCKIRFEFSIGDDRIAIAAVALARHANIGFDRDGVWNAFGVDASFALAAFGAGIFGASAIEANRIRFATGGFNPMVVDTRFERRGVEANIGR